MTHCVPAPLCALYARSSTDDPTGHRQLEELWEFIQLRGWKVVDEYVDLGPPGTACSRLDKLVEHASQHRFDCVLVSTIDRFAYSIQVFVERLKYLESQGIRLLAPFQGIDTGDTTPDGVDFLLDVAKACAKFD